jgi:hypothetical protein
MKGFATAVVAWAFAGSVALAGETPLGAGPSSDVAPGAPSAIPVAGAAPMPGAATMSRSPDRQRGSWYIGFGLGGGGGGLRIADHDFAFDDLVGEPATTVAINVHAGWTVTPRLLVGFDGGALAARETKPDEAFQLNYYDVGAMFFPWERGAFARVAAGRSILLVDTDGPVLIGKGTYGGWNIIGGVGYAFWLGKAFNLTLNVDYQAHRFSSDGDIDVARGSGWSTWVGFDWY